MASWEQLFDNLSDLSVAVAGAYGTSAADRLLADLQQGNVGQVGAEGVYHGPQEPSSVPPSPTQNQINQPQGFNINLQQILIWGGLAFLIYKAVD